MPAAWTLRLTGYDGAAQGELRNASERTFSFELNRMATGSFKLPLDDPLAGTLLQGDCLIQLRQGTTVRLNAEVISVEEVADASGIPTLAVTFADAAYWRLTHRLLGVTGPGLTFGTAVAPIYKYIIVSSILAYMNMDGDTGVRNGSFGGTGTAYVGPWRFKPFMEAMLELSRTLDDFDFEFEHVVPYADTCGGLHLEGGCTAIANLNIYAKLGTTRANTIFEYGTGSRNIKAYKRQVSREGLMTRGYSLPPGFPETSELIVSAESQSAIAARGIHESVVATDLTAHMARAELLRSHLAVRKQPRQLITFTPAVGIGLQFNTDYAVGDVVTARAKVNGSTRFNAAFRVYGVSVTLDSEGLASYELNLVPEA